jgi:hypothetical protein
VVGGLPLDIALEIAVEPLGSIHVAVSSHEHPPLAAKVPRDL